MFAQCISRARTPGKREVPSRATFKHTNAPHQRVRAHEKKGSASLLVPTQPPLVSLSLPQQHRSFTSSAGGGGGGGGGGGSGGGGDGFVTNARRFNEQTMRFEFHIEHDGRVAWMEANIEAAASIRNFQMRSLTDDAFVAQINADADQPSIDPIVGVHRDGFATLVDEAHCLSSDRVATLDQQVTRLFNSTMKHIRTHFPPDALDTGFTTFKMRQMGRYDMTIPIERLALPDPLPWLSVVEAIFGGAVTLHHVGCIMSVGPRSDTQQWHQDGPQPTGKFHTPLVMLNVFVPLVDLSVPIGGTEFAPGSHVYHSYTIPTLTRTPLVKAGQCVLFDYRVRHRGVKNQTSTQRPALYFSYSARGGSADQDNFDKKRYLTLPDIQLEETREERMQRRANAAAAVATKTDASEVVVLAPVLATKKKKMKGA